jgi:type VI secretion system protein ImpI
MYLTLEVVSPQGASLGSERRRIVGAKGLTIGRLPGNDWVIPDPYISKHHARIAFVNGKFFIEGLGKNTISIGTVQNALASGQPRPLKNGDRLFIDQYEILVCVVQGDPPGAAASPRDDPFAISDAASAKIKREPFIPDVWDGAIVRPPVEAGALDPLAALGGGTPAREPDLPPVNWQQASPLGDHFDPPVPRAGPDGIPDNWDRSGQTHFESAAARTPERPRPTPSAQRQAPRAAPAQWPAAVQAPPSAPRRPVIQPPQPSADFRLERNPQSPLPVRPEAPPSSYRAPTPLSAARVGRGTGVGAGLTELLRGAGLPDEELSPDVASELGQVLRVVVQGVMDALHARTEIKSQFRLPLTRIKAEENNPLKHCPNVESALHTLLVERNPGYLPTVQAFEDAFTDIRNHQMAMLEGLRVAFESMLSSFDPQALEREFQGKRGGLRKPKYWDLYADRFSKLGRDADDTFRRLFGDVFAEAYEKQLERLKTLER